MSILKDLDGLVYSSDESQLGSSSNVYIDFVNNIIKVRPYGYMSNDGVTMQCLYSFLKTMVWGRENIPFDDFIKFPIEAITENKFYLYRGYSFDEESLQYIKDAGLKYFGKHIVGNDISFDDSDNSINSTNTDLSLFEVGDKIDVYGSIYNNFTFTIIETTNTNKIKVSEPVASEDAGAMVHLEYDERVTERQKFMCVKSLSVFDDIILYYQLATEGNPISLSHNGNANDIIKFYDIETGLDSDYFKLYNRALGKTYNESNNIDMGYYPLDAKVYYYSLPTITDQNITHTKDEINNYDIDLRLYNENQTRQIDGVNYEFNIIIDAKGLDRYKVYEKERVWRITDGIVTADDSDITKNGLLLNELVRFEGDTLVTSKGVYIDGLDDKEKNNIIFTDINGNTHQQTLLVDFTFKVEPSITNYEYRIYQVDNLGSLSGSIELQGEENAVSDTQTYRYQYSGSDVYIAVQIISQPDNDYEESVTYYTLSDTDQSVIINLNEDNNN